MLGRLCELLAEDRVRTAMLARALLDQPSRMNGWIDVVRRALVQALADVEVLQRPASRERRRALAAELSALLPGLICLYALGLDGEARLTLERAVAHADFW